MKPTNERLQAATRVNVVSPEINETAKDDCLETQEVSIALCVKCVIASIVQLRRGRRQWHGTEWNVSEPGRPYHASK